MNASSPRRSMRWMFLLTVVAVCVAIGMFTRHNRQAWRDRVHSLYSQIIPGMSVDALRATIAKHEWTNGRNEWEDTRVLVSTPMALGATNWCLVVEWTNNAVTAVRVRNPNSWELLPPNAPADKTP